MSSIRSRTPSGGFSVICAFACLIALALAAPALAADVVSTWNGTTTGNWTDFTRWSSNPLYPNNGNGGYTYDAVINYGDVTLNQDIAIQGLTFGGGWLSGWDYDLTINDTFSWSGGDLGLSSTLYAAGGMNYTKNSDAYFLRGELNLSGTSTWTGSGMVTLATDCVIKNLADGSLSLVGTSEGKINGGTLRNQGRVSQTSTMTLSAIVQNEPSATWDLQAGSIHPGGGIFGSSAMFNNFGILRKSSGAGTATMSMLINNYGTVQVDAGILALTNSVNTGGLLTAGSEAVLDFTAGSHVFDGTYTGNGAGTVRLSGGYTVQTAGRANFNLTGGGVEWSGGDITADGPVWNSGDFTISGQASKCIKGTFNNSGTVVHTANETRLGNDSVFGDNKVGILNNLDVGTFDLRNGKIITYVAGSSIMNSGTFEKTSGSGTSTVSVPFNNTGGTLRVIGGTLDLHAGGTSNGGIWDVAPGACLAFTGATHVLSGAYTSTGAGEAKINPNGTISVVPGTSATLQGSGGGLRIASILAKLDVSGTFNNHSTISLDGYGYISISGSLVNAGTVNWIYGSINGSGTLSNNGIINLNSFNSRSLDCALTNSGTIVMTDGSLSSTKTIVNQSTGTIDLQGGYPSVSITNSGVLRKSAGTGTVLLTGLLNNMGTTLVQSGELYPFFGVTQLSGKTLTGGTWWVCDNSTLHLGSYITTNQGTVILEGLGSTFSQINNLSANQGSFSIFNGRSFTTDGALTNTGTVVAGSTCTLTVNGNYVPQAGSNTQIDGQLAFTGGGRQDFQGGTLRGGGTINSSFTVPSGGRVAPGSQTCGVLKVVGTVTLAGGSQLLIDAPGAGGVEGVDYDRLVVQHDMTGLANCTLYVKTQQTTPGLTGTWAMYQDQILTVATFANDATGQAFSSVVWDTNNMRGMVTYGNGCISLLNIHDTAQTGDGNGDGAVDATDYAMWFNNYGKVNPGNWAPGDFNGDGSIDATDYADWFNNYGAGGGPVPEPATLSMLALGGLIMQRRRTKQG